MTATDLFLPPTLIEVGPVAFVQVIQFGLLSRLSARKKKILYQVSGRQWSLASVEDLENYLNLVVVFEVDDNDLIVELQFLLS